MMILRLLISVFVLFPALCFADELAKITQIEMRWSNVFLLRGNDSSKVILVDTGSPSDRKRLVAALERAGVKKEQISLIVLTHAHADHAGLAHFIQQESSARIFMGKGDLDMAHSGKNRDLKSTDFFARLLKPIVDFRFEPFEADFIVEQPYDLSTYGIAGQILPLPGHTLGSLMIQLADGRALVGDMMRGEILDPTVPHEHFFHEDREQNLRNLQSLLDHGTTEFFVGHGGPLKPDAIRREFNLK